MGELEDEIARAKYHLVLDTEILHMMRPTPHPPRRVKNRTKFVRGPNGVAVPRS
jgi:hypothetical protein